MGLPLFYVALDLEREGFKLFTELSKQTREESGRRMEDFLCDFYADAISQTESQQSKEFFLEMLEMERGHRELLEGSIASLEESGGSATGPERRADAA